MKNTLLFLLLITMQLHSNGLIDIQSVNPSIICDLRYATKNNFTKEVVYDFTTCFVLDVFAQKLDAAQKELQKQGLGLKIWDGYRPLAAQWKFWQLVPDERYVSNPARGGGRHTRGTAVDVTLVDSNGNELEMPSEFDDFTENAHRTYLHCSAQARQNALLLQRIMHKHGSIGLATEWWHFDLVGWEHYPSIEQLL